MAADQNNLAWIDMEMTGLQPDPDRVIEKAVFGMLPKTSLAKQKLRGKLKVYAGAEHPHEAQQPKPYTVTPEKVKA